MTLTTELELWLAACIPSLLATLWLISKTWSRRRDAILVRENRRFINAVTWVLCSHFMLLAFWILDTTLGITSAVTTPQAPAVPSTPLGEFIVWCLIGGVFVLAVWTYGNVAWILYQERNIPGG